MVCDEVRTGQQHRGQADGDGNLGGSGRATDADASRPSGRVIADALLPGGSAGGARAGQCLRAPETRTGTNAGKGIETTAPQAAAARTRVGPAASVGSDGAAVDWPGGGSESRAGCGRQRQEAAATACGAQLEGGSA